MTGGAWHRDVPNVFVAAEPKPQRVRHKLIREPFTALTGGASASIGPGGLGVKFSLDIAKK
jgi:hypothetical protein